MFMYQPIRNLSIKFVLIRPNCEYWCVFKARVILPGTLQQNILLYWGHLFFCGEYALSCVSSDRRFNLELGSELGSDWILSEDKNYTNICNNYGKG